MTGSWRPPEWPPVEPRRLAAVTLGVLAALVAASLLVGLLEVGLSVPNAAPVYLLAVVAAGVLFGTWPAVLAAVGSSVLYDFFFVQPYHTLTIADASEWLNLLVFLVVAVTIGRLAALLAERAQESAARAREAQALFRVSRVLATTATVDEAAPQVLRELAEVTGMSRIWLALGADLAAELVVADTGDAEPRPAATWRVVLQRAPGDAPARWARTHVGPSPERRRPVAEEVVYRVRVEAAEETVGSLWAQRPRGRGDPDRSETRILSAAADQLGQAIRRDRLTAQATAAEVARQSDAIKTALLDSVSHDLRTPLATIRAAVGSLLDPLVDWSPEDRRGVLDSIDGETERLNRLVRNMLDLSRIEGGALHPELEAHDLDELTSATLQRLRPGTSKRLVVDVPASLPPVLVDDLYLDQVLTNLLENALRYGGQTVRLAARELPGHGVIEIAVEDDGPGVPPESLPRLFEKFYRVPRAGDGSRRGMGLGLTVVRGLALAMGGEVEARRSELGGLAVAVRLRAAAVEEPEAAPAGRGGA